MSLAAQLASTGVAGPNTSSASWESLHTVKTDVVGLLVVLVRLHLSALEHVSKA